MALATGSSVRDIDARYRVGYRAVHRHHENHMSPALVALAQAKAEGREADVPRQYRTLEERLERLLDELDGFLRTAKEEKDTKTAIAAVRELRATLETWGKATGQLADRGPQVAINLNTDPQIAELKSIILGALDPYPEAAMAVAAALKPYTQSRASIEATTTTERH